MTTPQEAIRVLNEALEADPEAVRALFRVRVSTSGKLNDHRSIQIGPEFAEGGTMGGYALSALGLINGIFGVRPEDGYGYITGSFDDEGNVLGFEETPSPDSRRWIDPPKEEP